MFSSNTSQVAATATQAEAVDFDGTNDYLLRSSDLTGNADGKTFTFSGWIWLPTTGTKWFYQSTDGSNSGLEVISSSASYFRILAYNTAGTVILNFDATAPNLVAGTFINLLASINLASTSNRYVYINDVAATVTWTTYTNTNIDLTKPTHQISRSGGSVQPSGRLANFFLDYTYRDMSVTANRRLFVTADLKPAAGQAALNPILYLPMSDPTTVGNNAGTGGNFTLTGTVARSGRGPNQYNAPYSDLDGSADYMDISTAISGLADGKQLTFQCVFNNDVASNNSILIIANGSTVRFSIAASGSGTYIAVTGFNSGGSAVLTANIKPNGGVDLVVGRNYVLTISIDLASTSTRHVYVDGQVASVTWTDYVDSAIDFLTNTPICRIGRSASTSGYWNGRLGALWFNTSYIDLSVASNRAKFVSGTSIDAKPVDLGATGELPTGTSPLIYLPMYGNNAGKNYGTGGDFTVNSGPFTGARGPNEFWGNKAVFNGTTGRLSRSTMSGVSASSTVSGSFWINVTNYPASQAGILYGSSGLRVLLSSTNTQPLTFVATNSAGTTILSVQTNTTTINTGVNYFVQYCFDMTNAAKRFVYINGVSQSLIVSTYTNDNIAHNLMAPIIGWNNGSGYLNGGLAEMYMTTSYIDFSQEAERLKFRDAFGYPVNLSAQITAAAIPTPPIYVRFDPASQGTNSGTGGDFTKTGTITDGGQL